MRSTVALNGVRTRMSVRSNSTRRSASDPRRSDAADSSAGSPRSAASRAGGASSNRPILQSAASAASRVAFRAGATPLRRSRTVSATSSCSLNVRRTQRAIFWYESAASLPPGQSARPAGLRLPVFVGQYLLDRMSRRHPRPREGPRQHHPHVRQFGEQDELALGDFEDGVGGEGLGWGGRGHLNMIAYCDGVRQGLYCFGHRRARRNAALAHKSNPTRRRVHIETRATSRTSTPRSDGPRGHAPSMIQAGA